MGTGSLISMIAALSLNRMITSDFYSYGLKFSYGWAISYWNIMGVIFAMAWLNIIAAISFQVYRIRTIRKYGAQNVD